MMNRDFCSYKSDHFIFRLLVKRHQSHHYLELFSVGTELISDCVDGVWELRSVALTTMKL